LGVKLQYGFVGNAGSAGVSAATASSEANSTVNFTWILGLEQTAKFSAENCGNSLSCMVSIEGLFVISLSKEV